jgi:hypothetical protein
VRSGEGFIRELCIALEHRWNPDAIFMLFTAYLDEADTHGAAPHMIMAGFLGTGRQWELFLRHLRKIQIEDNFNIFHATEFKHHAGEFATWSNPKSARLPYKLTDLVETALDQGITFDLRHQVYISEYRNTPNPKGIPYDSQYGLCFRYCLSYLINKLVAIGKKHRLRVVLERGHKNALDCERIFDESKLTLQAKGIDILGDFTLARKEEAAPLMVADFLAHSYLMIRNSGEPIGDPDTRDEAGAPHLRKARLLHLGLEEGAIRELKKRLQQDRWARQAYQKRIKASALVSQKVSSE